MQGVQGVELQPAVAKAFNPYSLKLKNYNVMSKVQKNYGWLNPKVNSAKTLINRAKKEIPLFREHIGKFEEQITLKSYAESTVFSYSRGIAQISLHFGKSPLELDPDEINSYLFQLVLS